MSETFALARLAISGSRTLVIVLLSVIAIFGSVGLLLQWTIEANGNTEIRQRYAVVLIFWGIVPSALASLVLFDFSSGGNLGLPESNCSAWILRSPIASWKIAIVPMALKTIWISILWLCFARLLSHVAEEPIPYVIPCFAFSSVVMWLMVIAWRPFEYPWLRLITLGLTAFLSWCFLVLLFGASTMPMVQWRWAAVLSGQVLSIASFLLAGFAAIRSIEVARTAPDGIIPETGKVLSSRPDHSETVHTFASPVLAYAWYELAKTRDRWLRTMTVGVLPIILIVTLLIPFNILTFIMTLGGFISLATVATSGNNFINDTNSYKLSSFLVRSPISTAALAWTRFAVANLLVISVFACVAFVFLGWSAWPANREMWMQWATDQAVWLGADDQAVSIGMRLSAMILIVVSTVALGFNAGFWWTGTTGRDWIMLVVVIGSGIAFVSMLMAFALWFSQQTDLTAVKGSLRQAPEWIAPIAITLLSAKLIASICIGFQLSRAKLASWTSILTICLLWILVVAPLAWTLAKINPIVEFKAFHCVAFVLLCVPLARVLALPIAMFHNLHR